MSAWQCDHCERGTVWEDRQGKLIWYKCRYCDGSGDGWAPAAVVLLVFALLCTAYGWFCEGMPGTPNWMRPNIGVVKL